MCAFCLCFSLGGAAPHLAPPVLGFGCGELGARCLASASSSHPCVLQCNAPRAWAQCSLPSQEASEPAPNGFSHCLCGLSTLRGPRKLMGREQLHLFAGFPTKAAALESKQRDQSGANCGKTLSKLNLFILASDNPPCSLPTCLFLCPGNMLCPHTKQQRGWETPLQHSRLLHAAACRNSRR